MWPHSRNVKRHACTRVMSQGLIGGSEFRVRSLPGGRGVPAPRRTATVRERAKFDRSRGAAPDRRCFSHFPYAIRPVRLWGRGTHISPRRICTSRHSAPRLRVRISSSSRRDPPSANRSAAPAHRFSKWRFDIHPAGVYPRQRPARWTRGRSPARPLQMDSRRDSSPGHSQSQPHRVRCGL
jgi:hypothetical protein